MIHVHSKPPIGPSSSLTTQQQSPRQQQAQQQQQPMVRIQQSDQMQQNQDDEWFTDNDESVPTTAYVLYDFDAKCPEELSVTANEVVTVIEDSGNGWLRVYRGTDTGCIPSAYVQFT